MASISIDLVDIHAFDPRTNCQRVELLVTRGDGESRTWTTVMARCEWYRNGWGEPVVCVTAERVVSIAYWDGREVYLMQVPSRELSRLVEGGTKVADALARNHREAA